MYKIDFRSYRNKNYESGPKIAKNLKMKRFSKQASMTIEYLKCNSGIALGSMDETFDQMRPSGNFFHSENSVDPYFIIFLELLICLYINLQRLSQSDGECRHCKVKLRTQRFIEKLDQCLHNRVDIDDIPVEVTVI